MTPHRSLDVACGCGVLATPQWSGKNPKQKDHSQFLMHFATANQCTALRWHCTRSATNLCALVGRFPCILSYSLRVEASQLIVEIVIQWLPETLRTCTIKFPCLWLHCKLLCKWWWLKPSDSWVRLSQHVLYSCNNKIVQPFIRQQDIRLWCCIRTMPRQVANTSSMSLFTNSCPLSLWRILGRPITKKRSTFSVHLQLLGLFFAQEEKQSGIWTNDPLGTGSICILDMASASCQWEINLKGLHAAQIAAITVYITFAPPPKMELLPTPIYEWL